MQNNKIAIQIYGYLHHPIDIQFGINIHESERVKIMNDMLKNIAIYFKEKLQLDLNNLYIFYDVS